MRPFFTQRMTQALKQLEELREQTDDIPLDYFKSVVAEENDLLDVEWDLVLINSSIPTPHLDRQ